MSLDDTNVRLTVRSLEEKDGAALDAYLCRHVSTSLPMLANLRRGGIVCDGMPFQAHYLAAVDRHGIHGVLSLGVDDLVMFQCPSREGLGMLMDAWRDWFDGGAGSLAAPREQLDWALEMLGNAGEAGVATLPIRLNNTEQVYTVSPERVVVPPESEMVSCRLATEEEFAELCGWRLSFLVEVALLPDSEELRAQVHRDMLDKFKRHELYVLSDAHMSPVAMAMAVLSTQDVVQIGGFYVPVDLRGRGYCRALMAQLAVWLGRQGVSVVSFLSSPAYARLNAAAGVLGYAHKGDYGLVLFDQPVSPSGGGPAQKSRLEDAFSSL